MCGICGFFDPDASGGARVLEAMVATLAHRGPDDRGTEFDGPAHLGHTRLSIIDLSAAGHQPMSLPDGSLRLSYNGEIYNFQELRAELEALGHAFRGHSDTEVVLHAFAEWGEDCFARLNGMFAMALYEPATRVLRLVRDPLGIKPLHYWTDGTRLVFGSEIKALLAHPAVPNRLHPPALHEYLYFGNAMQEETFFEGIHRVMPGTLVRFGPGGLEPKRYWDLASFAPPEGDVDALAHGVRERLDAAVRRHLVADVPVGVFLSGGVDSSAIATLASRHVDGLRTYTAAFEQGADVDERPRARRLAESLGTDHRELFVRTGNVLSVIETLVRAHDEPFADAANIPLYLLCGALRDEGIKVVLQGDGGDEIFAGYRRYNVLAHAGLWRAVAPLARRVLALAPERPQVHRLLRFLRAAGERDPALRMAYLLTLESPDLPPTRVFTEEARALLRPSDPFRAYRRADAELPPGDPVDRMLATDCRILLPDTFLTKVDRPTMAQSVEVRVPFLDRELVEYAAPIPARHKVRRLEKKYLLRRALRGLVPDEILDGQKHGLDVPYERWLRGDLREPLREVLLEPGGGLGDLLDRAAAEKTIAEHAAGERDHGFLLYKLLNLGLWQRAYRPTI